MKKITVVIAIAIIISLFATGLVVLYNIKKTPEANTVSENIVYENAYITSSQGGIIKFVCDGNEYEVSGTPSEEVTEVADIVVENGKITLIRDKENITSGRLISYDEDSMVIDSYGRVEMERALPVYRILDSGVIEAKLEDIIIGADSFNYVCENGKVCALIQKEQTDYSSIRVLILNHDQIYYDNIWVKSESPLIIADAQTEINQISVTEYMNNNSLEEIRIDTSKDKLYFSRDGDKYLENGYEGSFIIRRYAEGLVLINELGIEDYVRYVLPSEMPVTFSYEALKAQAVCARTFAYSQMKNATYSRYGANLDDSTSYQVYNCKGTYEVTDRAVQDTKGKVVSQNNKLITCYYFSTCSSMTENMEVWNSVTPDYIKSVESKDESSLFYSWSAKLDISAYSDSELGKLRCVTINKRSDAGYVLDLVLQFENGRRNYNTENDIRKFMGQVVSDITLNDGSVRSDLSMLPSACFTIEDDGVTIHGGGFGHGIGMSQYGANELAIEGKSFIDIISYYYNAIEVKDIAETAY